VVEITTLQGVKSGLWGLPAATAATVDVFILNMSKPFNQALIGITYLVATLVVGMQWTLRRSAHRRLM
jgi:hypothetical protein